MDARLPASHRVCRRSPTGLGRRRVIGVNCKDMETINFTRGVPANESFPVDEVIEAAGAILESNGRAMLQYGPSLGFQPLREWLAGWLGVHVDRVLTGNGSLQLIEFLCLHMLEAGD